MTSHPLQRTFKREEDKNAIAFLHQKCDRIPLSKTRSHSFIKNAIAFLNLKCDRTP
ncbi:hypothetical protein H6F74_18090 [Trichocoleus sp. FACHB-90]|uniref:hypothetical protein n=1 Tax=Cyanophyceae TaxID=3028117 RepID=UPI0016837745|nr:hypothetical protein [Trichocoleus sp. FACHB-90]MBD1928141.1 hypothetical protein [Trichocoleus sp. FACHB-90]